MSFKKPDEQTFWIIVFSIIVVVWVASWFVITGWVDRLYHSLF